MSRTTEIPHPLGSRRGTAIGGPHLTGGLLVLLAALAWSTAGLFTRVVSTDIPTTLFWRALSGGVCVLAIAAWSRRREGYRAVFSLTAGDVVVASLSATGMVCYISAFFFTSIANVSFLYGTMPLLTLLLSVLILKERPGAIALACCALCALGVGVMSWGDQNFGDRTGMLLAVAMSFFMAAITVAAKRFPETDVMRAAWLTGFLAAVATAPFATLTGIAPADYLWLALYGLINIGFGFGLYLVGTKQIPTIAAALIGLVEIPLAPVWAYLLFNETITARTFLGGVIILLAAAGYLAGGGISAGAGRRRKIRKSLLP